MVAKNRVEGADGLSGTELGIPTAGATDPGIRGMSRRVWVPAGLQGTHSAHKAFAWCLSMTCSPRLTLLTRTWPAEASAS